MPFSNDDFHTAGIVTDTSGPSGGLTERSKEVGVFLISSATPVSTFTSVAVSMFSSTMPASTEPSAARSTFPFGTKLVATKFFPLIYFSYTLFTSSMVTAIMASISFL
ncbi:MAG: hypothetical protein BWY89_01523 [Bacteroidetes bacterium ADurb.BinA012]|nr:MAG: hypothetical protein BWY89_01523 [Bacteroidetes bacterium ADurb.BinA012]